MTETICLTSYEQSPVSLAQCQTVVTTEWRRRLIVSDSAQLSPTAGFDALSVVNFPTEAALLADVEAQLRAGKGFAIATLNLDHVVKMRRDPAFLRAYLAHSHVVADGNPIVWMSRLAGLAARLGTPLALLGSTGPVLAQAAERLKADYPGLEVAACLAPPYGFDPESAAADALLDQVAASGARICLLALGAPKQERLAARGLARHPGLGFLSIGARRTEIAPGCRKLPHCQK